MKWCDATWWFILSSVHWSVDWKHPGHSVRNNKWSFVCLSSDGTEGSRVESNPYEQPVTRCHVVGRRHNDQLKEKVNNINPHLYGCFTTGFCPGTSKKPQVSQEAPKSHCAAWPELLSQYNINHGSTSDICWLVIFEEGMYDTYICLITPGTQFSHEKRKFDLLKF